MREIQELTQFYKALGDETRLQLIQLLAKQKPTKARCVGSLANEIGTTVPNISQHLRVLKELGLVQAIRCGYQSHYFLIPERFEHYQKLSTKLFGRLIFIQSGETLAKFNKQKIMGKKNCSHRKNKHQFKSRHYEETQHPTKDDQEMS